MKRKNIANKASAKLKSENNQTPNPMTKDNSKATPRPWKAKVQNPIDGEIIIVSVSHPICKIIRGFLEHRATDEANAALIVRAVNQFEALNAVAEAAEDAVPSLEAEYDSLPDEDLSRQSIGYVLKKLKTALSTLRASQLAGEKK